MRAGLGRRLLWFGLFWLLGVAAIGLLALLIRLVMPY
jgi:hypothetical protein